MRKLLLVAVVLAAVAVPGAGGGASLPRAGIAVDTPHGLRLYGLDGRLLTTLRGHRLEAPLVEGRRAVRVRAPGGRVFDLLGGSLRAAARNAVALRGAHTLTFRHGRWTLRRGGRTVARFAPRTYVQLDADARTLTAVRAHGETRAFDLAAGREVPVGRGCRIAATSPRIEICGYPYGAGASRIVAGRRVERGAAAHGWWRSVAPGAGGRVLAEWSGECEIPTAYAGPLGRLRPVVPRVESVALGWAGETAVVLLPEAGCGTGASRPGVYAVGPESAPRFLAPVSRAARVALWRL